MTATVVDVDLALAHRGGGGVAGCIGSYFVRKKNRGKDERLGGYAGKECCLVEMVNCSL